MAHIASQKIAGPLLRAKPPATPEKVKAAFTTSVGLRAPHMVVDEWVNEARRRNGIPSTSALIGAAFRTQQELRKQPKTKTAHMPLSLRQRIARRISRLFRKH